MTDKDVVASPSGGGGRETSDRTEGFEQVVQTVRELPQFRSFFNLLQRNVAENSRDEIGLHNYVIEGLSSVAIACIAITLDPDWLTPAEVETLLSKSPFGRSGWLDDLEAAIEAADVGDPRINLTMQAELYVLGLWISRLDDAGRVPTPPVNSDLALPPSFRSRRCPTDPRLSNSNTPRPMQSKATRSLRSFR